VVQKHDTDVVNHARVQPELNPLRTHVNRDRAPGVRDAVGFEVIAFAFAVKVIERRNCNNIRTQFRQSDRQLVHHDPQSCQQVQQNSIN
jgi:hypothetical protein